MTKIMLDRYKLTVQLGARKQDEYYFAKNPDHACEQCKTHIDNVYQYITLRRIIKVVLNNVSEA